jgi:hypothetical protein
MTPSVAIPATQPEPCGAPGGCVTVAPTIVEPSAAIVTNEALKMPFDMMGVMADRAVIHGESRGESHRWPGLLGLVAVELEVLDLETAGGTSVSAPGATAATVAHAKVGTETRSIVYRRGRRIFLRLVAYAPARAVRSRARGRHPRRERRQRRVARASNSTGDLPPPARPCDLREGGRP